MINSNTIYCGDCLEIMSEIEDDSIDAVVTDPPYGISFMGKKWDKAIPSVDIWCEVLRVMKPGAFAAILCTPRQDCQARMILNLESAGFITGFTSIMWTYSSGFPKAGNLSKLVDRRRRDDPRPVCRFLSDEASIVGVSRKDIDAAFGFNGMASHWTAKDTASQPAVPTWDQWLQLKDLIGFGDKMDSEVARLNRRKGTPGDAWNEREVVGRHLAPAKSIYSQAENTLSQDVNITVASTPEAKALDGAYSGFQPKPAFEPVLVVMKPLVEKTYLDQALVNGKGCSWLDNARIPILGVTDAPGRFPANVLCSDDALNDGDIIKTGSYSRYFDLGKWWDNRIANLPEEVRRVFPWLIVPKPSKKEKGVGNKHPTVKPLRLLSYLVTLFSQSGDTVLDPFGGSGTTGIASKLLDRNFILIEKEEKYCQMCCNRLGLSNWEY